MTCDLFSELSWARLDATTFELEAAQLPLVALMPTHWDFDTEATAANQNGFPVVRYGFDDHVKLTWPDNAPAVPCTALWRGFMLSGVRYRQFADELRAEGLVLLTPPDLYEHVHYYPNAYPSLESFSPRATWAAVPDPSTMCEELFAKAVAEVRSWGCELSLIHISEPTRPY
eukprot:TRINITY_DN1855_c0_g1_i2.p1 TRINITY_DN1855_c0_g1~~TRINITY_DN1855_c0_g1_i2.p1  ORF type:complete len:172 (+),score=29.49 TRINITY_DN1855_c0_g1_i2:77-592(+)